MSILALLPHQRAQFKSSFSGVARSFHNLNDVHREIWCDDSLWPAGDWLASLFSLSLFKSHVRKCTHTKRPLWYLFCDATNPKRADTFPIYFFPSAAPAKVTLLLLLYCIQKKFWFHVLCACAWKSRVYKWRERTKENGNNERVGFKLTRAALNHFISLSLLCIIPSVHTHLQRINLSRSDTFGIRRDHKTDGGKSKCQIYFSYPKSFL